MHIRAKRRPNNGTQMNTLKLTYWVAVVGYVTVWCALRIWAKNSRPHFNKRTKQFPPYGVPGESSEKPK
ncbi:hypothetical protein GCM10009304_34700 [Pseudomonas matsuisoli]|uniref:Uncharacterized protein n=1 Tax=Pseudomonas matsuisoli TaxID=1515666 RepID=A0A917Q1H2_9PSED|nr:hypothetical protein GCM10009304_34700 [Pseudomonas matsuisoli]